MSAADHLQLGWRIGLEPSVAFEPTFLRPFYEAAGEYGPPVLTWLDLSAAGFRVPSTRAEAEHIAERFRDNHYFDAASYSRCLPAGMDPALHYAVIGEFLGWQPSEYFDPRFYGARYEDIAASGSSPLAHYMDVGQYEGRRPLPAAAHRSFPPLPNTEQRAVLVICHEASRTGTPILGWNLARRLKEKHQVVSVLMRGGELEQDFAAASAAVIGPMTSEELHPLEMSRIAEQLVRTYDPLFALANGIETSPMVPALAAWGVPTVALVHEFTADVRQLWTMSDVYDWATHVVLATHLVARSSFDAFPGLAERRGLHVLSPARKMGVYVEEIDRLGRAASDALRADDVRTLADSDAIDIELALAPNTDLVGVHGVEHQILVQWSVVGTSVRQAANPHFRRAVPGFHPQAYAVAHQQDCCEGGQNPTAHWLRAGRPQGPWSHHVFSPLDPPCPSAVTPRVALHAHFFYPDLARDLAQRMAANRTECDLFVSTDTPEKAERLQNYFAHHRATLDVRVMPNRGRDLGPLLTGFAREISSGDYDVFGHVHGKQSPSPEGVAIGGPWRDFLWDNLIGGEYPIVDLVAGAFGCNPALGLLMAEDPHLVGWDANRETAESLARRVGITGPLPEFFDFPLGTMFWARPAALRPLLNLRLSWNDYPDEPVPYDGTLLHALERLLPFVVSAAGLTVASIRVPGTGW